MITTKLEHGLVQVEQDATGDGPNRQTVRVTIRQFTGLDPVTTLNLTPTEAKEIAEAMLQYACPPTPPPPALTRPYPCVRNGRLVHAP